jgi:hypothetical protein
MGWIEALAARIASEMDELEDPFGLRYPFEDDEDEFDEDLPPIPCDGSVCCPCGRCDGLQRC